MAHINPVEFDGVKLYVDWTKPGSYTTQEILTGAKVGSNHGEALATSMGKIAEWHDWLVPSGGQEDQVLTWDTTYTLTTSQPSDWSTNYKAYYTKSGDDYIPVTGNSAPTWAASTYYKFNTKPPFKWTTLNVYTKSEVYNKSEVDQMIDDTRKDLVKIKGIVDDVTDLPTTGNHNGDVYYVGEYVLLTSQPADWSTNWTDYYTKNGDDYVPVTGGSAPTFAANTYYEKIDGYEEYIWIEDDGYVVTTAQPADWTTNWRDYYVSDGHGGYTPVTGDTAPTWTSNTYYEHTGDWEALGPRTFELPDASTTQKGIVMLSDNVSSDASNHDKAVTPYAVSQALAGLATYAEGTGIKFTTSGNTTTISTKLKSTTALQSAINVTPATTGTTDRLYPVQVDSQGYLAVNVPWVDTDTDTTYTAENASIVIGGTGYNKTIRVGFDDTITPSAPGTAAVGTSVTPAHADHVHPLQTYVAEAGTAETLKTPRAIDGVSFDGSKNIHHYATCTTGGSTANKVATISSQAFVLETGARVMVKFSNKNTAAVANLTLNVNSTGAKSIKCNGANLDRADIIGANGIHEFVYDGTYWELVSFIPGIVTVDVPGLAPAIGTVTGDHLRYLKADSSGNPVWTGDPVECDDSLVIHCTA